MKLNVIILFLLIGTFTFAQKTNEVVVSGTVYISGSTSMGTLNGESYSDAQHPFKNQPVYFQSDSTTQMVTMTDSLGRFSISLKPAVYILHQEAEIMQAKSKMTSFGTFVIDMLKYKGPYKVEFKNNSVRRSTMGGINKGAPSKGNSETKTTKKQ